MCDDQKEKACINACLNNDHQSFRFLVECYYQQVFSLAFRLLKTQDQASDICQITFLKAFEKLSTFNHKHSFKTWLLRIAVNTVFDQLRKSKTSSSVDFGIVEPKVEQKIISREISNAVQLALHNIPVKDRLVLVLKDIENLSYQEMSLILKRKIPAIKIHVIRARTILAEKIKKMYPDLVSDVLGK